MTAAIVRGDARHLPLPAGSVDLIVTSPPYFALRSYTDGGEAYDGQIGAEPTPGEYIDALLECTREWMRVLKESGSIFVVLGDAYYSGKGAPGQTTVDAKSAARTVRRQGGNPLDGPSFGVARKSRIMLPERYRIGCVDQLGLIARAVIIWSKPNGLPESVTDRVRVAHEDVVHLVKRPRYFSAVDEIREPYAAPTRTPGRNSMAGRNANLPRTATSSYDGPTALGALPGSVWEIASQPLIVPDHVAHERCCDGRKRDGCTDGLSHYAGFPPALVRRIILGWSPPGICTVCGKGRRPVSSPEVIPHWKGGTKGARNGERTQRAKELRTNTLRTISGYVCACAEPTAPTRPAVVLDPFGGAGTTALVASVLGRHGVTVDRSADYCRLATWRVNDPGERARALGVPKPPPIPDAQLGLFGEESA